MKFKGKKLQVRHEVQLQVSSRNTINFTIKTQSLIV